MKNYLGDGRSMLREALKQIPGARRAVHELRRLRGQLLPHEITFARVVERNEWEDAESVSGTGSNIRATEAIRRELPLLWRAYGIRTLLDVPCGDFHWMRLIVHELDSYTGMDVVRDVIQRTWNQHTADRVRFLHGNLLTARLPAADCIMVRDCLVHFSYRDALRALRNLKRTPARYVLLTTFPKQQNRDSITGAYWRPLNLEAPPFSFPPPIALISEECDEIGGTCRDKSLGLWELKHL